MSPEPPVPPSHDRLRCGVESDVLLDQVAAGRAEQYDTHQSGCPHCQAALAEYDRLWSPVREMADTEVRAPDTVLEEALRRIRGATAQADYGTLTGPAGATRISARVVVVLARESAEDIAGVRVALSKLVPAGTTAPGDADPAPELPTGDGRRGGSAGARVVAGVAGRSTAIEITLAAEYGTDLHALGERIRTHIAAQVRDLTGLEPVTITVRIDDVFDKDL